MMIYLAGVTGIHTSTTALSWNQEAYSLLPVRSPALSTWDKVADSPMPLSVQAKLFFSLYCSLTYVIFPFSLSSILCEASIKSNNTAFVCTAPRSPMHGCWRINSSCQDHFPLITKHPPWSPMRCGCMERGTHIQIILNIFLITQIYL